MKMKNRQPDISSSLHNCFILPLERAWALEYTWLNNKVGYKIANPNDILLKSENNSIIHETLDKKSRGKASWLHHFCTTWPQKKEL